MEEENKKYVYLFKEGNAQMKDILGGKGANLAEMTNLGLPIPQGFTISAECCKKYYEDDLVIDKINLDITDDGVVIEYIVNKEITESDELLIYFIRIEKDSLSDYEFASRRFELN